jgi:protein arginine kinase activator
MHKGTVHTGKQPVRAARAFEAQVQLKALHRELRKAVAEEDYESAARLRDQIRRLEVPVPGGAAGTAGVV